jgi:hypothetical protein
VAPASFARGLADGAVRRGSPAVGDGATRFAAAAAPQAPAIPAWALDVDGNGVIDERDRALLAANVGTQRGFGLEPLPGYDYRADLRGRAAVTAADLDDFDAFALPGPTPPRPVVMCWHYGWYHPQRRPQEPTTATYLGGDYRSDDPAVERRFHLLKHEFGIDADLLSWIDPSLGFEPTLDNYDRGYFAATEVATRRFGWLYETAINLRASAPFQVPRGGERRARLVEHFRQMALRMMDPIAGTLYGNVLRFGGRPVIFMFASHLLGTGVVSLFDVALALAEARDVFAEITGVPPYLIGDEAPFVNDLMPTTGRLVRATFFDAVARYHHYEAEVVAAFALDGPVRLGGDYLTRILELERRAMQDIAGVRNRFTNEPVWVIPSSAAGFAKRGFPTLLAGRDDYVTLLRAMRALADEHLAQVNAQRATPGVHTAAPALVGSWNEEFEGHALFPTSRNEALVPGAFGGFEWLSAIKEVYGSSPPRP